MRFLQLLFSSSFYTVVFCATVSLVHAKPSHEKIECPVIDPEGDLAAHISFLSDQGKETFHEILMGQTWLVTHEDSQPSTIALFSDRKEVRLVRAQDNVCTYHMDEPAFSTIFTLTRMKK